MSPIFSLFQHSARTVCGFHLQTFESLVASAKAAPILQKTSIKDSF